MIALLDTTGSAGVDEARRQGASAPAARRFVEAAFASASDSIGYVPDEQSLRAVGVDLEGVRARAEREFGAGSVPMRVGAQNLLFRSKS